MANDQFQYVKLPDGSYGKFAKTATDAEIRALVAKNFPNAYKSTQPKPTSEEAFKLMSEKAPENARFPRLGRTGYDLVDSLSRSLPGLGSWGGAVGAGIAGGPAAPLTAVGGAGLGAAAGDRAEQMLNRLIYKDLPDETWGEAARSMFVQGALGAFSEGGAQTASKLLDNTIETFGKSAQSVKNAKDGRGIRLTPGEASGGTMLKKAEGVLEHWPGGAGQIEHFRDAQEADVYREVERQLNDISKENLSSEEAGKAVKKVMDDARGKLDTTLGEKTKKLRNAQATNVQSVLDTRAKELSPQGVTSEQAGRGVQDSIDNLRKESETQVGAKFDEVRKLLGKPPGAHMTPEEFDRGIAELGKKTDNSPTAQFDRRRARLAGEKLSEARHFFKTEQQRFDVDIFGKVLKTQKPELIGGLYEKAGLDDLRTLDKSLAIPVKRNIARNVYENMVNRAKDPQTGVINTKTLATSIKNLGDERGRLIFGNQYTRIRDSSAVIDRINQAADRAAETVRRTGSKKFDADLIGKIAGTNNPELVSGFLKNASPDDLRTLKTMLPKQVQQNLSRNVLESFVSPSRDLKTASVDPGVLARSLDKNLRAMGETRGRVIFGDQYDNIVEASRLLNRIATTESGISGKMHMASFLASLAGAAGLAVTGHPVAGAGLVGGEVAGPAVLSFLLTSPRFSPWALRTIRGLAVSTARGIPYVVNQNFQSSPAQYAPLPALDPSEVKQP